MDEEQHPVENLAKDLARQIKTEANARFLRRMPLFSVDHDLPQKFGELLGQLDRIERHGKSAG